MPAYMGERQQIGIRLPLPVYKKLKARAKREGATLNELVTEMLQKATARQKAAH